MRGEIRPATSGDAVCLFEIRRAAILELAPPAMPIELAREWANAHPPEWISAILTERAVWVLDFGEEVAGWISATANNVDGLYTKPSHVHSGCGSRLLRFIEAELSRSGFLEVTLHGSLNAIEFYRSRGYEPVGSCCPSDGKHYGGLPMRKLLPRAPDEG